MRVDLPSLSSGRAAAQASHAANAFWHKYGNTKDAKAWAATTPQGFGTAIVLGVTSQQMYDTVNMIQCRKLYPGEIITDTDYVITFSSERLPFMMVGDKGIIEKSLTDPNKYVLHRQEDTYAYVFGNKEDLAPILGVLPLYS